MFDDNRHYGKPSEEGANVLGGLAGCVLIISFAIHYLDELLTKAYSVIEAYWSWFTGWFSSLMSLWPF